jgi:ribosomal protein L6P/L9E
MKGYRSKVYKPIKLGKIQVSAIDGGLEVSLGQQKKAFLIPVFMGFKTVDGYLIIESKKIGRALSKAERSLWGTVVSLIASYVAGLIKPHCKQLFLRGPGYRAAINGKDLVLNIGHSHEHVMSIPDDDVKLKIKNTKGEPQEEKIAAQKIVVSGADKQKVGDLVAKIISNRPYNVCSGNGILLLDKSLSFKRKSGAGKK